jgi:hypothetical protein
MSPLVCVGVVEQCSKLSSAHIDPSYQFETTGSRQVQIKARSFSILESSLLFPLFQLILFFKDSTLLSASNKQTYRPHF